MINIPECKRTKNISVSNLFRQAVKKSSYKFDASVLPENSYYPLYIGKDYLDILEEENNAIIWGRRGTGKTHLLKAFNQKINEDKKNKSISYYISCDGFKDSDSIKIDFEDDFSKMKFYATRTYTSFMNALIELIIDTYKDILIDKFNIKSPMKKREKLDKIEKKIDFLIDKVNIGSPQIYDKTQVVTESEDKVHTNNIGGEIDVGITNAIPYLKAKINGIIKLGKEQSRKKIKEIKYNFEINFMEIRTAFNELLNEMGVDQLYICIDELWSIDQLFPVPIQPLFLEYIKRTFFRQRKLFIKIASIREATNLNAKLSVNANYGIQSGHDILEVLNLDVFQFNIDERISIFKEILISRINYFCKTIAEKDGVEIIEYDADYILESLFKDLRHFKNMVGMSGGVPRHYLHIFYNCLKKINYKINEYYVHTYLISSVVIEIFDTDRRSDISMNSESIYSAINNYMEKSKNYFFIIKNEQVRRLYLEINNLIYCEILHRIPSSLTPFRIKDIYKAYFIDSGKYLSFLRECYNNDYSCYIREFNMEIPDDLVDNTEKYILNIDNIEDDFLECKICSSRVNKNHPVYKKHGCCTTCGTKLQNN